MPFISCIFFIIISLLSLFVILSFSFKEKYLPLFIVIWIVWTVILFLLFQLPIRKERIECGIFSFKVHKKYIPDRDVPLLYDVEGDEDYGLAFINGGPDAFTRFEYGEIANNKKLDTEDLKKVINNAIKNRTSQKDIDGNQRWFVSCEPFTHKMFASVDYISSTTDRKNKRLGRDIIFIHSENTKSYLCRLHLARKSKWALNRSQRIFFNTLRFNPKSITTSQRGTDDDTLDEPKKGLLSDLI